MGLRLPKQKVVIIPPPIYKRVLAFLLDIILINIVLYAPFRPIITKLAPVTTFAEYTEFLSSGGSSMETLSVITVIMAFIALLYFVIFEYTMSQTPGKIVFNMTIISTSKEKNIFRYLLRSLFIIPIFPIFLLWFIEPFYMVFNPENQRLLEKWSKTRVVQYIPY